MGDSRNRERDRFAIGMAIIGFYGLTLLAPMAAKLVAIDPTVVAVLAAARDQIRDFAFLVVAYYFATSKGSTDKTALLSKPQDPAA